MGGYVEYESKCESKCEDTMDIASIPRIESIVLTGLDFSMNPEKVRFEAQKDFIKGLPETKVMHIIKSLAVMVYNQEKMTPFYHSNVCDVRNPLAFFLCAVHRQQAPQPKTHARHTSNSSQLSNSNTTNTVACKSASNGGKKTCELPKLSTTSMLPLGNWDCLYYALVAEIWKLHSDLQDRFGFGCENGTTPIHYRGRDGMTQDPITPIDLASLLETAWYALMDHRLVATLDNAVRMKSRDQLAKHQGESDDFDAGDKAPVLYGLIDVNALDPDTIIHVLWEKYRAEVDEACVENFEDESMLSAYRAKQYAKQIEESLKDDAPLTSTKTCKCHRACVCKLKCDVYADECTCNHEYIYRLLEEHEIQGNIPIKFIKDDGSKAYPFIGATSHTMAQMLIPVSAETNTFAVQSSYKILDGFGTDGRQSANKTRKRTNTNNSELAYVPDSKTFRAAKDAYPLGFYGRDSGQRYPKISSQGTMTSSRRPSADNESHPFDGVSMPSRKPVPASTPASASPASVTYPAIPVSQSQSMFTQSFPAPGAGNPRDTSKENKKSSAKASRDPADDYVGLLSEHPSATDYAEQYSTSNEPFPKLIRSVTTSPPRKAKSSKTTNDLLNLKSSNTTTGAFPTLKALNKPQPPLPEPDFISPKPAVKQRYVSAGGNTPLSERTEISGPVFTTTPHSKTIGRPVTKDELEAKMSDPEWVIRNFGESALGAMSPPRRTSNEDEPRASTSVSKRNSGGRVSDESGRETPFDKRDRTSSGASKREKLKRIFSRKESISETEY